MRQLRAKSVAPLLLLLATGLCSRVGAAEGAAGPAAAAVGAAAAATQGWIAPSLSDHYQYQLGELFVVPDHLIPGVKVGANFNGAAAKMGRRWPAAAPVLRSQLGVQPP
jgi:hypothetical protein